jgi:hypothetical protein
VDTPEGKVIYYPYVPASVGPLVAGTDSQSPLYSSKKDSSKKKSYTVSLYRKGTRALFLRSFFFSRSAAAASAGVGGGGALGGGGGGGGGGEVNPYK